MVLDNADRGEEAEGGHAWVPGHARNPAVGGSGGSGNEMRGSS